VRQFLDFVFWTPLIVANNGADANFTVGRNPVLLMADGKPAIVYSGTVGNSGAVYYIRANDSLGPA
jgi:hypothetical protein